jgi:hypothetical protein
MSLRRLREGCKLYAHVFVHLSLILPFFSTTHVNDAALLFQKAGIWKRLGGILIYWAKALQRHLGM